MGYEFGSAFNGLEDSLHHVPAPIRSLANPEVVVLPLWLSAKALAASATTLRGMVGDVRDEFY